MNDNETVEQVCREISCSHEGMIGIEFGCVANRIFAAHKREIAEKDAEIKRLTNIINTECNKCGDCAKFGGDCSSGDVEGNEDCRACSMFVSKEIASLRALVKELADALDNHIKHHPVACEMTFPCSAIGRHCNWRHEMPVETHSKLVAKAREVCK